jgi:hypothetical protein
MYFNDDESSKESESTAATFVKGFEIGAQNAKAENQKKDDEKKTEEKKRFDDIIDV